MSSPKTSQIANDPRPHPRAFPRIVARRRRWRRERGITRWRRRRRYRRRGRWRGGWRSVRKKIGGATVSRKHSSPSGFSTLERGGSVAVTLLRPDSQWSCPQPTDEQFWHIHGQRPRRSAFYLLISLAFKRDLEHIRRCSRSYSILVILQTLAGRRGQCFSVALSSLLFNLIRLRIADALWTSPWHVSIFTLPILIDGRRLESCRDEFHRFQLFRASVFIYIYICIWMEKKEGSNDGIFFFFLFLSSSN